MGSESIGNIEYGPKNQKQPTLSQLLGQKVLYEIPGVKEEVKKLATYLKDERKILREDIEKRSILISEIQNIGAELIVNNEVLLKGILFISNSENCSQEYLELIKYTLTLAKNKVDLKDDLELFFNEKGFFNNAEGLELFKKKFKITETKKEVQETKKEVQETKKEVQETKKEVQETKKEKGDESQIKEKMLLKIINKLNSHPNSSRIFQETLKIEGLTEEGLKKLNIKEQTEFFKKILNKLYQSSLKETEPEKKKELKQSFSDLCENLKSVGMISDTDIANIIKLGEQETGVKDESILEINGFRKIDEKENIFYKDEGNTNNIITIDENGQLNEKIGSDSSSYEVSINSGGILGEELNIVTRDLLQANFELNNIDGIVKHNFGSQEKLEKIIEILDKDPNSLNDGDYQIYKTYKDKKSDLEGVIKTRNTLKDKIQKLEDKKIELEIFARNNSETTEDYKREKELAKNKVEILDTLGFTNTFSNENLDKLLEFLGRDEMKQILGFKLDFSPERKEVALRQLKTIFAKLLNSKEEQIYRPGTLNINYPYSEITHNLSILMQDPKILDGGVLQFNGVKDRLMKEVVGDTQL